MNMFGYTSLIAAAHHGSTGCAQLLIDARSDLEAGDNIRDTALMWAARNANA